MKSRRQITDEQATAFAAGADSATPPTTATAEPQPERATAQPKPRARTPKAGPASEAAGEWPDGVARSLLIKYAHAADPQLLAQLAEADDRSQHKIAQRALSLGLRQLAQEMGLA